VMLLVSMCMSATDDEAGISKIVRDVNGDLADTNEDPEFLADIANICPLSTQVDILHNNSWISARAARVFFKTRTKP
jgi:hypothetical protein